MDEMALQTSVGQFAYDFYAQVVESQSASFENAIVSPMSIYIACLLTMVGAAGGTLKEMRNALYISPAMSDHQIHESFKTVFREQYTLFTRVELSMANRLFLLNGVNVTDYYKETLEKYYDTDAERIVNLPDLEAKRQYINEWVYRQTKEKIVDLMPPGVLNDFSVLAMVNALYFRGNWEHEFDKNSSQNGTFFLGDGSSKQMVMMQRKEEYRRDYMEDLNATAIRIPFNESMLDMLIILPDEINGLPALLGELKKAEQMKRVLEAPLMPTETILELPRFKLSELPTLDAKPILQKNGITTLFDIDRANLSRMNPDLQLFVSDVLHKAIIEVDEEGATAAAASSVVVGLQFVTRNMLRIDHPFFFALTYNNTFPLFIGHVVDPESN